MNRRLNEEFQRAFEAGIPSSAIYLFPAIYHIGTPSDRTTSEGFRSALSHGTFSVPSHPSPVSFEPSTPVQSPSAAPVGWQCLEFLLEVFLVRIQVIDLYQSKLQFHFYLHNKELEIQLHSCLWGREQ